jgi:tetratricopeptide (TPR) repeat protein
MGKSFVNRIDAINCLKRALQYDGREIPVLVFTGIGGMGKTALRRAFEDYFVRPKGIPSVVLDYDGDPNLQPIEGTLRAIRRQLGRQGVKTPVFDFLYARYFELSMGVKLSSDNAPPELEGIASILDGIPGVGNISQILYGLGKLGLSIKERVQHQEWLYRVRDLEPREILTLLPEVLASDLEEAMLTKSPKILMDTNMRIVILFDAYERLSESQIDDTLHRSFLLNTPLLLRAIFTRDPLPWERSYSLSWKDKIHHYKSLDNLAEADVHLLLEKRGIEDRELQAFLFQLTRGYPLHLELCTDICSEIANRSAKKPAVNDFEGLVAEKDLTEELINRLLRQLKEMERDLIRIAAIPRWVSEEVLEVLSSVPESVPRIFQKFIRLSMFSPHPEIEDAYVIQREVRESLLAQNARKQYMKKRHLLLHEYHKERWKEEKPIIHLMEAVYHGFFAEPAQAMELLENTFWKLLDACKFGDAEGVIEAIPEEILADHMQRKIDYMRARLLLHKSNSKQIIQASKRIFENLLADEKDEAARATYLYHLGDVLCELGDYDEALEKHHESLTLKEKYFGENSEELAASINNIGRIFLNKGEYEKALQFFHEAIKMWSQCNIENDSNVAKAYNNMGVIYCYQGKHDEAVTYHRKALHIRRQIFNDEHPEVATSLNNIGLIYRIKGDLDRALEYFTESLSIWQKTYGEEHPNIAVSYHNMGIVYYLKEDYANALEYYNRSLTIRLMIYGENHPTVAETYTVMGLAHMSQKSFSDAFEYSKRALDIWIAAYGDSHPNIGGLYTNLGMICSEKEEFARAMEYFEKALSVWQTTQNNEYQGKADTYCEYANALYKMERKKEAIEKIQLALDIYKKLHNRNMCITVLDILAQWLAEIGRQEEAEKAKEELQQCRKRMQGI